MAASNVNIRMDSELKAQLQELMSNLGLDLTSFFTMAAKQAIREQALPFRPEMEKPNMETLKAIAEVEYMIEHPEIPRKTYNSFKELLDEVMEDDDV